MRKIRARDILHVPAETLRDTQVYPEGQYLMEFDDGESVVTWRGTIFSWFLWANQRKYPQAPLLRRHHLGAKRLIKRTTSVILGDVISDAYDVYSELFDELAAQSRQRQPNAHAAFYYINDFKRRMFMEDLCKVALNGLNDLYNYINRYLPGYMSTLSMFDVFEINEDPEIIAINNALTADDKAIDMAHAKLIARITDPDMFIGNNIAEASKSNLLSLKQLAQLHSSLGFRTDCDYTIFPNPILVSGYHGYNTIHDFATESRSATKALVNNKAWLSNTQYTNRRVTIIMESLKGVIFDDCGNTATIPLFVTKLNTLSKFEGKRYLDESGNWDIIDLRKPEKMRSLVNTTIHFRTSIRCKHRLQNYICSACMGEMARTIPLYTNLGHASAFTLGEIFAQATLSTKHYDGNASFMEVIISKSDSNFFIGNTKESVIRLNNKGKLKSIIFNLHEIPGIKALQHTDNIKTLVIANISNIRNVVITTEVKGESIRYSTNIQQNAREVYLSHAMLEYVAICLRNAKTTITQEGELEVPLEWWDYGQAAFSVSRKNENITDLVNKLNTMILGASENYEEDDGDSSTRVKTLQTASLYAYDTPEEALMALYDLMSGLEEINIVHLESIVIAFSGISDNPPNYAIGRGHPDMKLIPYSTLQYKRSFAQLLSLNQAKRELNSPSAYLGHVPPPHPFDQLVLPIR